MNPIEAKHRELQNAVVQVTGVPVVLKIVNLHAPARIFASAMATGKYYADCGGCPGTVHGESIDWPCDTVRLIARAVNVDVTT